MPVGGHEARIPLSCRHRHRRAGRSGPAHAQHRSGALYLLLDTGHAVYGGADPAAYARAYGDRIAYVHLKDVRPHILAQAEKEGWGFLERVRRGVFTVPGDGCVDFPAVLEELDKCGYEGWMILEAEQDPAIADPLRYAAMGKAYLLDLLHIGGDRLP